MATDRLLDTMDELWFYRNVSTASGSTLPSSVHKVLRCSDEHMCTEAIATDTVPGADSKSGRKARRVKRYRSLSELESYELKGLMDLGFTFPKEKLDRRMLSMVPGLQSVKKEDERRVVRRPYLSEAWLVNSPRINVRVLQRSLDGADMKRQIKVWAQTVAWLVQEEPLRGDDIETIE